MGGFPTNFGSYTSGVGYGPGQGDLLRQWAVQHGYYHPETYTWLYSTVSFPAPNVRFSYTQKAGGMVEFQNTSKNGVIIASAWNFGDGSTSSLKNPSHVYAAAGTYAVTLRTQNSAGISSKRTNIVVTIDAPTASISATVGGYTAYVTFTGNFTPTEILWSFGDGRTATTTANADMEITYPDDTNGTFTITAVADGISCSTSITIDPGITISWKAVSGATGYRLYYNFDDWGDGTFTRWDPDLGNVTSYSLTTGPGMDVDRDYDNWFYVVALDGVMESAASDIIYIPKVV